MTWLGNLSTARALTFAALWPAFVATLLYVVLRGMLWWLTRGDGGGGVHIGIHVAPAGWLLLASVMLVPPMLFLATWRLARR